MIDHSDIVGIIDRFRALPEVKKNYLFTYMVGIAGNRLLTSQVAPLKKHSAELLFSLIEEAEAASHKAYSPSSRKVTHVEVADTIRTTDETGADVLFTSEKVTRSLSDQAGLRTAREAEEASREGDAALCGF